MSKIELYNEDCLKKLKDLEDNSIDMILTDPPYGISFQSNYRKIKYDYIKNDNNLEWLDFFINECFRIVKNNTSHYIFCSYHNIDLFKQSIEKCGFKIKNLLVWEKNSNSMGDLKGNFASRTEFIIFFQKGRCLIKGKRDHNILRFKRTKNKFHSTEKPVDLLEFMIKKFSNEGDIVLDPFLGSGSTGIAAKKLNRDFIGIELEKDYFEIAKKRIENE